MRARKTTKLVHEGRYAAGQLENKPATAQRQRHNALGTLEPHAPVFAAVKKIAVARRPQSDLERQKVSGKFI